MLELMGSDVGKVEPVIKTPLTVASVQFVPLRGDLGANVTATVNCARDASLAGAQLVVFPELSLIGYDLSLLAQPECWTFSGDPRLEPIRKLAQDTGSTVVVGGAWTADRFDAVSEPQGLLASLVFQPSGLVVVAPKMHLHGSEDDYFMPGDSLKTVDVDGWTIALAVCFDAAVPDHAQRASEANADVYAVSALYTTGQEPRIKRHLSGAAARHGFHTLLANLGGEGSDGEWTSCGLSGTWGVNGESRSSIDTNSAGTVFDVFEPRTAVRPSLSS